jgi:alkylation response protein AidB-like acyl-CoA dehydrogenase
MDFPAERFLRDLRVHEILEGTSQIMRHVIGRDLVNS